MNDKRGLLQEAIKKYIAGVVLIGVLIFLPAGSISWRNGWILMTVLFVPMYSTTVLLFLSMPLILGSWPSFLIMLLYIPIIVKRIRNEEQVLEQELKGYTEYNDKVKYRLIPLVW